MHPVADYRLATCATLGLEYLGFVVGESEVVAAAVDVELLAEVLERHRRALNVPTRSACPPRAVPRRLARLGEFPQREVAVVPLARTGVLDAPAGTGSDHLESLSGKLPELFWGGVDLEVDSIVTDVRMALVD